MVALNAALVVALNAALVVALTRNRVNGDVVAVLTTPSRYATTAAVGDG